MRWEISRQELVLFHPRHKRVRLFYEHNKEDLINGNSGKNEDFNKYRKHAQDILETLRAVLNEFPKDAEVGFANNGPDNSTTGQPTNNEYKIDLTLPADLNKNIFLAYLIYWRLCLKSEGWEEDAEPNKAITALVDFVRGLIVNPSSSFHPLTSSKSTLIHLLSTLPILPHWDLWGTFSSKSDKNKEQTLLGKIRECTRPVYASQFKFKSKNNSTASISKEILGYQVKVRVCYCDDYQVNLLPVYINENDFFNYCHNPKATQEHNENELYRSYGILIDSINRAMLGGNNEEENNDDEILFQIAYPIKTSLGRLHFWHIWLKPENPEGSLEQLWASWWPLHQRVLNWPSLHNSLANELEQLDIAYAQEAILHEIKKPGNSVSADEVVCQYGYMLFSAKCLCTKDKYWRYEPYFLENEIVEITGLLADDKKTHLLAGSLWKDSRDPGNASRNTTDSSSLCNKCGALEKSGTEHPILFYEDVQQDTTPNIQKNIQHLRYRRLVDQQKYLAKQMFATAEKKNQELKDKLNRENAEARVQVTTNIDPAKCRLAIDELLNKSVMPNLTSICPELESIRQTYINNINYLRKFENKPEATWEGLRAELVLLLETDLHTLLSWYLESEPVLSLCHEYEKTLTQLNWNDFYKNYSTLHSSCKQTIKELSDLYLNDPQFNCYKANLEELLSIVDITLINKVIPKISHFSQKRDLLRDNKEKIIGELDDTWKYPELEECQAELHLPLTSIKTTLELENLWAGCINLDTSSNKLVFRFLFSNTPQRQTKATGSQSNIMPYRNCFAITYNNGINFIQIRDVDTSKNYPAKINTTVKIMNELRMGKLFFGTNESGWSFYQVTAPNSYVKSDGFLEVGNKLKNWIDKLIDDKKYILVVCFDGWDSE